MYVKNSESVFKYSGAHSLIASIGIFDWQLMSQIHFPVWWTCTSALCDCGAGDKAPEQVRQALSDEAKGHNSAEETVGYCCRPLRNMCQFMATAGLRL